MGANYAWYYNAGDRTYYWTESFNMSATQFANEVSELIGKPLTASDVSAADKKGYDSMLRRAARTIYVS